IGRGRSASPGFTESENRSPSTANRLHPKTLREIPRKTHPPPFGGSGSAFPAHPPTRKSRSCRHWRSGFAQRSSRPDEEGTQRSGRGSRDSAKSHRGRRERFVRSRNSRQTSSAFRESRRDAAGPDLSGKSGPLPPHAGDVERVNEPAVAGSLIRPPFSPPEIPRDRRRQIPYNTNRDSGSNFRTATR